MKIHFLEHDHFDFSKTNIALWARKNGHTTETTFVCNGEEFPDLHSMDWLMVMGGSPYTDDEDASPWLSGEKAFVSADVERGTPVLGICFGAQLLAYVLGGDIFPGKQKEIGWYEIKLTREGKKSPLFRGVPEKFVTFNWHEDQFFIPPGCESLARSMATPNQAFLCKNRPIAGLQFHPEYTLEMVDNFAGEHDDEWIVDTFVGGKEKVIEETKRMAPTYWLMEKILDNLNRQFHINGGSDLRRA